MLNFLIAVIQSNYNKVINFQEKIAYQIEYQHKAELNEETYQLYSYVKKLECYKIIVFTTSKQQGGLNPRKRRDRQFIAEIFDIIKS